MQIRTIMSWRVMAMLALALAAPASWPEEPKPVRLYGLNFSPNLVTQAGKSAHQKAVLEDWIKIVAPYTRWIRTFESGNQLGDAGAIAHRLGLNAAVTAWLGPERDDAGREANERAVAQLIALGQQNHVDLAIVGSEVLFRGDLSPEQLLTYLDRVKTALPHVPVTTADTHRHLLEHPEVLQAVDAVFMNHYGYWEGIGVEQAIPALHTAYQELGNSAGRKTIIVSESGWPSCGETIGEAVASPENAQYFLGEFINWAQTNHVPYFYFEAFDEPWKVASEGPQGACWGIWDHEGRFKTGMGKLFDVPELASDASPEVGQDQAIEDSLPSVPPKNGS